MEIKYDIKNTFYFNIIFYTTMDPTLTQLILDTYDRYMLLNIYTENNELRDYYVAAANNHNNSLFN